MSNSPPVNDEIAVALARLVDDGKSVEKREPTHSDIEFQMQKFGLRQGDPANHGHTVGKAKRVRAVLNWAITNDMASGEHFVAALVSTVRGLGGFRDASPNYCGSEAVTDLQLAFDREGWELSSDGILQPKVLGSLRGETLSLALQSYARRARQGCLDSPLLAGTAKDLVEATAAHILNELWGGYTQKDNFPTLLGQCFVALGLATPSDPRKPNERVQSRVDRSMYDLACSLNALRNKEGTGHGRPWIGQMNDFEARYAIESMGTIAQYLLDTLQRRKKS